MNKGRRVDKGSIVFSDTEVKENRKRLEERNLIHLDHGFERASAYEFIISKLGDCTGPVLEIGTGRGVTAALIAKKYCPVTTVDISDTDIKTSVLNAAHEDVLDKIDYHICDAGSLPFQDNEFECSISINGFHHFENARAVLGEMLRVTRKRVVVADFSQSGFEIVRMIHRQDGNEHEEHESDAGQIEHVFRELGYEAQSCEGFHHKVFVVNKKEGGMNK